MSRWRQTFQAIGGPDAVTWPAFWVTCLIGVMGNLAAGGAVDASAGLRLLMATTAQVVAFAPLVALRLTVLRDPPRPRPWVAIAGFLLAAVARGSMVSWLFVTTGSAAEPLLAYRIVASIGGLSVPLLVIAIVVSKMRAHTRSLEALVQIQAELVATEARIVDEVTIRNEDALARVQERLRTELAALASIHSAQSVVELQRLATDVVRPMSHELAASMPARDLDPPTVTSAHVTWTQAAVQMVDRPPLQPLLAAAYLGYTMVVAALGVFGLARGLPIALTMVVAIAVTSWLANWLLGWALPRLSPRAAPPAVVLASLAVGYASVAVSSLLLPDWQSSASFVAGGGIYASAIVALAATVTTILRQQRVCEQALAASTEELRRQLVRLRQAQWLQQQALSRALHGPVQAAVTAAAIRLDAAAQVGAVDEALLDDTRGSLLATIDVLDTTDIVEHSVDLALARVIGTWEGVCQVTAHIDDVASARLEADSIASAVTIDVMTEAVSNSVRHGGASHAAISITCTDEDLLELVIRDDGRGVTALSTPGLGTTLLDECTLGWQREADASGCVLRVVLPLPS